MKTVRAEEIKMMSDPMAWPHLILPIKRYVPRGNGLGQQLEAGVLAGHGPVVYLVNMWALDGTKPWKDLPQKQYTSFAAIVDDGWIVD